MVPLPPDWEVYQQPSQRASSPWLLMRRVVGFYGMLAVVYAILASVVTYPLIANLSTHTAVADASGDQFQTIWSFWWLKASVTSFANPYWTDAIYWPHGTGLGYHLSPFLGTSAIVIATLTGQAINSIAVFNLLVLLSYVVTGLGAFALIRHVTEDRLAAFCGSLFVALSPYRLWHLNHLNLLSFGLGLFAIFLALRFLDRPRAQTLLAAVLFMGAAFYSSLTLAMLVGLFLIAYGVITLPQIWRHPERRRVVTGIHIGIILLAAICAWGLWELNRTDSTWSMTWQGTETYSANLLGYVIPGHTTSQTARWFGLDTLQIPDWGGEIFLGWLLVIMSLGVSWRLRGRIPSRWMVLGLLFMVLSFGPTLQIGSHRFFEGAMPYRWLFDSVPYLSLSRAPTRFAILVNLGLAVTVAQGIAWGLKSLKGLVPGRALRGGFLMICVGALVGGLFAEYTTGRIPLEEVTVPEVYRSVAADLSLHVIYEGPIAEASQICNLYMYWQTFHERKVVNGYLTHHSQTARELLDRMRSWREFTVRERDELQAIGVDAIIYHSGDDSARLIRLDDGG